VVDAQPDNLDAAIALGHAYYEYAVVLYQAGQQPGSVPYWLNAVIEYDKALAADPTNPVLLGNKAFALYYAGSSNVGPALVAFIDNPQSATQLPQQVETARQMLAEVQAQSPASSLEVTTAP
jgi:tetratricopeptide (TPR) repeat protein